jgi:hypothetical protein
LAGDPGPEGDVATVGITIGAEITGVGWAQFVFSDQGQVVNVEASYLCDSPAELVGVAIAIRGGARSAEASFTQEPGECGFRAGRSPDGTIKVNVLRISGNDTEMSLFEAGCRPSELAGAVITALTQFKGLLSPAEYEERWGYEYPAEEIEQLRALLRESTHSSDPGN